MTIKQRYPRKVDDKHDRLEVRECWATLSEECLDYLRGRDHWKALKTLAMIRSERRIGDKKALLKAKRSHWGIESRLHWVLDIAFHEDIRRFRKDHAPENFAILRHMAINMLKQEKSTKCGIQAKRLLAGWDGAYLLKVLSV
jgi:hypothetical protein